MRPRFYLIKAHLDLGQLDRARAILEQLYARQRPDWKESLGFWETELAKARVATTPAVEPERLQVGMLVMEGPIWLKPTSPAAELFPANDAEAARVAFLGGSAEIPTNSQRVGTQLTDTRGHLSRAIPLFLAEQVELGTNARTQTLVPWITSGAGGFVLTGAPWSDEQAAGSARQGEMKNGFVVCIHFQTASDPWIAHARLIRTIDGTCVGTVESPFSAEQPTEGLKKLAQAVAALLEREADLQPHSFPSAYSVPDQQNFAVYLLRLEQLLAVRCVAMCVKQGGESFLSGEREILDGNLQQCLAFPKSVSARALLAQTFWTMKIARPEILPEFRGRWKCSNANILWTNPHRASCSGFSTRPWQDE